MQIPRPEIPESITVTSPNFAAGDHIPTRFTCKGAGIAPAFGWVGVPTRARARRRRASGSSCSSTWIRACRPTARAT